MKTTRGACKFWDCGWCYHPQGPSHNGCNQSDCPIYPADKDSGDKPIVDSE